MYYNGMLIGRFNLLEKKILLHIIFHSCDKNYIGQIGIELNQFFKLPVYYGNYLNKSTNDQRDYVFTQKKCLRELTSQIL